MKEAEWGWSRECGKYWRTFAEPDEPLHNPASHQHSVSPGSPADLQHQQYHDYVGLSREVCWPAGNYVVTSHVVASLINSDGKALQCKILYSDSHAAAELT